METRTLGWVKRELEKCGLRGDFIAYLDGVVKERNYIAHEIIANEALFFSLDAAFTKNLRMFTKATYHLEQVASLFDIYNQNEDWGV